MQVAIFLVLPQNILADVSIFKFDRVGVGIALSIYRDVMIEKILAMP